MTGNYTWKTKKGEKIQVKDLEPDHLANICRMLKRNGYVHSDEAWRCLAYSGSAPDGAAMAAENAFASMKFNQVSDAIFERADRVCPGWEEKKS